MKKSIERCNMFSKVVNITLGLVVGAVCGIVAASLITPKNGEAIRNDIRGGIDEIRLDYETEKQRKRDDMEADIRRRWGE